MKFRADGSIDKHKARLVAKGYSQIEGIDFEETFSPIAKLNTIRMIIALATKHRWKIHQLDAKYAFLNGNLKEEVYLVQPEGLVKKGEEQLLYRLKKALYGLKQAPLTWYETLTKFLKQSNFKQGSVDPTLFLKKVKNHLMIVQIYVDDIIFGSTDPSLSKDFENLMKSKFEMSMMGKLNFFLGLNIKQKKWRNFYQSGSLCEEIVRKVWAC